MNEDNLYSMSDEELETAFREAKQEEELNYDDSVEQSEETPTQEEQEEVLDTSFEVNEEVSVDDNQSEQVLNTPQDNTPSEDTQPQTFKIKANGKEYDFTQEELIMLAPKALDYTKKTQALAPYRKIVSAMEENNITNDDINMLIDIKKGNKDALAYFLKDKELDPMELDLEQSSSYTPNEYGKDEKTLDFQDTLTRLKTDSEFARTQNVLQNLDETSKQAMISDPTLLEGLHIDVKNGIFDRVMPLAEKMAVLDNYSKPLLDYYVQAGASVYENLNKQQAKQNNPAISQQQEQRKDAKMSASLPKVNHQTNKPKVVDYLNIDDEEYEQWYKQVMSKY